MKNTCLEHDYEIVHRKFLKDYRLCRVCGYKEVFDYVINLNQVRYDLMNKHYVDFEIKAKRYDDISKEIIKSNDFNKVLLGELFDLNSFVETDGLLEEILLNSVEYFDNSLNLFLLNYLRLLSFKAEKEVKKLIKK
jgi:hypothetical protein